VTLLASPACDRADGPPTAATIGTPSTGISNPASNTPPPRFRSEDLPFRYVRGATGLKLPVEVTGGGVGMLDHDGDGDLDLFFAQGGRVLPGTSDPEPRADVLLRNEGGGRFVDASAEVGLAPRGYGQGVTVADYDGDGDPDVYVTRYGPNTLWRNDGGRFVDATDEAGVGCPLWSLGAAFLDYDGDEDLDLFVANYFDFDPSRAPFHHLDTGEPEYGPPAEFPGLPDMLYRNEGYGRFVDVTASAGISDEGRGMGVTTADFDGDGRIDILVANDAEANALWLNRGDGTFEEAALERGVALNGAGLAEANMGIARGDVDGDGLMDLLITHFVDEHDTLWRAEALPGGLYYRDATLEAGLGLDSLPLTGWGCALADFDQDGHLDLVVTNGHIRPEPDQTYRDRNPPILWRGLGGGRFANVTATAGPYFQGLHMGRGLACGDLDGDLDLDLVVTHHDAPAAVLWNETPEPGNALMLHLRGAAGNRDAIGAVVTARVGGRTLVRSLDGGGDYLSTNDPRIHLGVGPATTIDHLRIRWPFGLVEARHAVPVGRVVVWHEPGTGAADKGPAAD
jgi:hypothetical protein